MRFQQIVGYILLIGFIGFLVYKFTVLVSDQQGSSLITFLVVLIVVVLLLAIRRILIN